MKNTTEKTTYTNLNPEKRIPPTIVFSKTALRWIDNLVDMHSGEVGFYGVVDSLGEYKFYVRDIFYPKQQLVNSATCEISIEGGTLVAEWLINHDRPDDVGKMILWGHSHHSMGVSPSGQDNSQAIELMNSTGQNLLRVIVNKAGLLSLSFFDYEKKIKFDNITWEEEVSDPVQVISSKIAEISAVVSVEMDPKAKFEQILKICQEDTETKIIRDKIEELKKINIPAQTTTAWDRNFDHYEDNFSRIGGEYNNGVYTPYKAPDLHDRQTGRQMSFLNEFSPHHTCRRENKKHRKVKNITSKTFLEDSHEEVNRIMANFGGV
ncbi:MAG: hypothetical protein NT038_09625 [Euryarchaeota archaeon]|nr:hypothetical protein [Euryarchaeota archaeon]